MMQNLNKRTTRSNSQTTTLPAPSDTPVDESGQAHGVDATPVPSSISSHNITPLSSPGLTISPTGRLPGVIIPGTNPGYRENLGTPSEAIPPRRKQTRREKGGGRKKWSTEDNTLLMKLYYLSNPTRRGFRKRLHSKWRDEEQFEATEQRLADQVRSILNNKLLSDVQLLEVRVLTDPSTATDEQQHLSLGESQRPEENRFDTEEELLTCSTNA